MTNNIVIYTAISNNYDGLKDPIVVSKNCDYICFTDNKNIKSKVWKTREFAPSELDDVRKCREIKLRPHKYLQEYEYSIWIDGNIELIKDVNDLIKEQKLTPQIELFTFQHPVRNCIYTEAEECIKEKKDNDNLILAQIKKYFDEGYPNNHGLVESNVILRRHNSKQLIRVMEDWWSEIVNYSRRDQLSFNYVTWKNNYRYGLLPGNSRNESDYFKLGKHKYTATDIRRYIKNKLNNLKRNQAY